MVDISKEDLFKNVYKNLQNITSTTYIPDIIQHTITLSTSSSTKHSNPYSKLKTKLLTFFIEIIKTQNHSPLQTLVVNDISVSFFTFFCSSFLSIAIDRHKFSPSSLFCLLYGIFSLHFIELMNDSFFTLLINRNYFLFYFYSMYG